MAYSVWNACSPSREAPKFLDVALDSSVLLRRRMNFKGALHEMNISGSESRSLALPRLLAIRRRKFTARRERPLPSKEILTISYSCFASILRSLEHSVLPLLSHKSASNAKAKRNSWIGNLPSRTQSRASVDCFDARSSASPLFPCSLVIAQTMHGLSASPAM